MKPARKAVGGSRVPQYSASLGGYGDQPHPRIPRRTAQDTGASERILCGATFSPATRASANILGPGVSVAGRGGGGAAHLQTPGVVYVVEQRWQLARAAGILSRPASRPGGGAVVG